MQRFVVRDYVSPECLDCPEFMKLHDAFTKRRMISRFNRIIADCDRFQEQTGRPVKHATLCGCSYDSAFSYLHNGGAYALYPGVDCRSPFRKLENQDFLKAVTG